MSYTERNQIARKNELKAYRIDIECLDALETFDMSNVKMVAELSIGDLNKDFNLVYPELTISIVKMDMPVLISLVQRTLSIENQPKHS